MIYAGPQRSDQQQMLRQYWLWNLSFSFSTQRLLYLADASGVVLAGDLPHPQGLSYSWHIKLLPRFCEYDITNGTHALYVNLAIRQFSSFGARTILV